MGVQKEENTNVEEEVCAAALTGRARAARL
jgi:hypothetical protein